MSRWKKLLIVLVGLSVIVGMTIFTVSSLMTIRVIQKGRAWHADASPEEMAQTLEGEFQTEPHTCGWHALSAIYRGYGLDPERENLRFRLGTDRAATIVGEESKGTLHPDIFRVLVQDQFDCEIIAPETPEAANRLREHLMAGQKALLLVIQSGSHALHWVAADGFKGEALIIVDSLKAESVEQPLARYLQSEVLSILAIYPEMGSRRLKDPHSAGIQEMKRVYHRMRGRP